MNHNILYYYPRKDAVDWSYTPGRLTFESIDRFVKGNADYWEKDVRQTEEMKRNLVICNWGLTGYSKEELDQCIEVLLCLLDQKFVIYAPEAGDLIKLTPKNIKEKLQNIASCGELSCDDRNELTKKLALHDVTSDSIGFLDYFACQQLFFNDKENRIHSIHVERSVLHIDAIISSLRQSAIAKPIAVFNGYNLEHKRFVQLMAFNPGMREENQIRVANISSNEMAEHFLKTYSSEQLQLLEEITFRDSFKSPTSVAKILALAPNLKQVVFRNASIEGKIEPALFGKIDLSKLERLAWAKCEVTTQFMGELVSKAPHIKRLDISQCKIFGFDFDLEIELSKLEELNYNEPIIDGSPLFLWKILSKAPILKILSLNKCKYIEIDPAYIGKIKLSKLESFSAFGSSLGPIFLEHILCPSKRGSKLKRINLCYSDLHGKIKQVGMLWKLESLNFADTSISFNELGLILSKAPNLVTLNLNNCQNLRGEFSAEVKDVMSLIFLETLLCSKSTITAAILGQILKGAKRLKELDLTGCNNLYARNFEKDVTDVLQLKELKEFKGIDPNRAICYNEAKILDAAPPSFKKEKPKEVSEPKKPSVFHSNVIQKSNDKVHLSSYQTDAVTGPDNSKNYATLVYIGKDGDHPDVSDYRQNVFYSLRIKDKVRPGEMPFEWYNDESFELTPCADQIHWMYEEAKIRETWELAKQSGYKFRFGIIDIPSTNHWMVLDSLSPEESITHMCVDRTYFDIKYAKKPNLYFVKNTSGAPLKAYIILKIPKPVPIEELDPQIQKLVKKYHDDFKDERLENLPPSPTGHDYLNAIISQQKGACRHRAVGLYKEIEAYDNRIKMRGIKNTCHVFVELKHNGRWVICDPGGVEREMVIDDANHPHLSRRQIKVSKKATIKESIQEYFRHHIVVYGKNTLVEIHSAAELQSALRMIQRDYPNVHYVAEPKYLQGVCEGINNKGVLVVNLSAFDENDLPQFIDLTKRKKIPKETCIIGLYILKGSFIEQTEEFLDLFNSKLELTYEMELLAQQLPPEPLPLTPVPEPIQEIFIPPVPAEASRDSVEPVLKRLKEVSIGPAAVPVVPREKLESKRQLIEAALERKVLETLWDVDPNEDIKLSLQFDSQGEPINFAEIADKFVFLKGKNVHIAVHSPEELDLCTFWLQRHFGGTYYIDRPEEIRCSEKWIDPTGVLRKGPGGPLYDYIKKAARPVFILNFNTFTADDLVLCNSFYDKNDRTAQGVHLPPDSCVIGLSVIHPNAYKGDDFKKRFIQRIELAPFPVKSPVHFEEPSPQALQIDLYGVTDWKEKFTGSWIIDGDHFVWKTGILEEKHPSIEIQNGPWDNRKFRLLWQQELLRSNIRLSKSENIDWNQFEGIVTWTDHIPPGVTPVLINPSFLGQMELSYRLEDGKLSPHPGCIEMAGDSTLYAYMTAKLTQEQWYLILKLCKENHVKLHVVAPKEFADNNNIPTRVTPSADIFVCDNVDASLRSLQKQYPKATIIHVTGCDCRLVYSWDVRWISELEFRFEKLYGSLYDMLQDEEQHVILWGEFSGNLLDALMPWLLHQEKYDGKLTMLTEKTHGLELFQTIPYFPHEVSSTFKVKPILPLPSKIKLHPFEAERFNQFCKALNKDLHVCIEGISGVGKTTFIRNVVAKHPDFTVYYGKEQLLEWAKCDNGTIPFIFEDEINMNIQVSHYEGMYHLGIIIDGIYHKLTPLHRWGSAKNPDSFGGERREVPFLTRHPNSIEFTELPNDYLYDAVLKQYELPRSSADIFLTVYKHAAEHLTPRELEMMALVGKAIPDRDPRITAYRIAKYALPKDKQQAFHNWFTERFGKITLPTVDYDLQNFVLTDSRQEAYGIMTDFLAVRKLRRQTGLTGGLGGVIFEGIPRDGKSHFVEACLKANGFVQIFPQEIETCHFENAYCIIPANLSVNEKRECHLAAFNAGILVIENEMNACPALEPLHNALAMGFDESFQRPKKQGYGFIATQNPIYMAGRRATTSPMKHRVMFYEFTTYGQREVFQIVHKKFPALSQEVVRFLTQKKFSFGELLNIVEKGVSNKKLLLQPLPDIVEQQGPVCKLYALSAVMNWIYLQNPIGLQPPPARKRDRIIDGIKAIASVRQFAKRRGISQQGEVYSPNFLVDLAKSYGFKSSCIVEAKRDNYDTVLKEIIDSGRAPIVFFDVEMNTGRPIKLGSKQEHAAICVGYFYNLKNELFFTLMHWGKPWVVKAEDLADSTNQLSLDREPETFYKVNGAWRQRGDRQDVATGDFDRVMGEKTVVPRTGKKSNDTFRNKIVIVA